MCNIAVDNYYKHNAYKYTHTYTYKTHVLTTEERQVGETSPIIWKRIKIIHVISFALDFRLQDLIVKNKSSSVAANTRWFAIK